MNRKMADTNRSELASEDASNAEPQANEKLTFLNVNSSASKTPLRTNLATTSTERQNGFHVKIAMPTFIEIV
jgi:hypothetical protein